MATPPEVVRAQLALVTAAAAQEMVAIAARATLERQAAAILASLPLLVPSYYDAAGALAVSWYDELRDEAQPRNFYTPRIVGDPTTDWIEREAEKFRRSLDGAELEREMQALTDEIVRLAEKEVARGYRDSITGNTLDDADAIGWSRVTRPGACKFCLMLADRGAVYSKVTAKFAAHTDCNCASRPEFEGGEHGPEASVVQYLASKKRSSNPEIQAARNARVREYLNDNYPDAPG